MRLQAKASEIIAAALGAAPRAAVGRLGGIEVAPTIDANGRMHAPADGYEWNGTIYRGGEYLGDLAGMPRTRKIKARADAAVMIAAALDGECGAEYHGRRIAYVPLTEGQWAAVQAVMPIDKAMVLASEAEAHGWNHGKTFKFSYKRWINAHMHDFEFAWCEGIGEDKQGKVVCYAYGEIIAE